MDRGHLQAALDGVLDAVGSSATSDFSDAAYTENGQRLPVGEGLWATADKVGPYCHAFIDEESGQAACFVTLTEGKSSADYLGKANVEMDLRIAVLPSYYNFPGEQESGARRFDDKSPYLAPGEGSRTTEIPPALKTPLTAPVAGGPVFKDPNVSAEESHNG